MTTISCCEGDAVLIGDHLRVTVLEIDGDQVLLQIEGPEDALHDNQLEPEVVLAR